MGTARRRRGWRGEAGVESPRRPNPVRLRNANYDFKKGINIIKNTAANKVPLTDNRHSKKRDMLSVIFSILTLVSLPLNVIHPVFMFISLLCIILWITCRSKLLKTYLHYGNSLFVIRAILLMHCLDIVRFTCAMIGLIQYKYLGIKLIKSLI